MTRPDSVDTDRTEEDHNIAERHNLKRADPEPRDESGYPGLQGLEALADSQEHDPETLMDSYIAADSQDTDPLDRIEDEAEIIIEYGIAVTPEDVLTLVAVARAAREVSRIEATGVLPDFIPLAEALARLDGAR